MNSACHKKADSPREQLFAGKISPQEYIRKIEQSKEGDRNRRAIAQRFNKVTSQILKNFE